MSRRREQLAAHETLPGFEHCVHGAQPPGHGVYGAAGHPAHHVDPVGHEALFQRRFRVSPALVRIGIVLSPAVGAIFMSVSTIAAVVNAPLLRRPAL